MIKVVIVIRRIIIVIIKIITIKSILARKCRNLKRFNKKNRTGGFCKDSFGNVKKLYSFTVFITLHDDTNLIGLPTLLVKQIIEHLLKFNASKLFIYDLDMLPKSK